MEITLKELIDSMKENDEYISRILYFGKGEHYFEVERLKNSQPS